MYRDTYAYTHIHVYVCKTIDEKGSNEFKELERVYGRPLRKAKGGRNVVTKLWSQKQTDKQTKPTKFIAFTLSFLSLFYFEKKKTFLGDLAISRGEGTLHKDAICAKGQIQMCSSGLSSSICSATWYLLVQSFFTWLFIFHVLNLKMWPQHLPLCFWKP